MRRPQIVPVDEAAGERRTARLTRGAWITGAAVLLLVVTVQPLRDTDVWWHLALGRYIAVNGIPAHEPFSFLPAAFPWVGQQWLYEVMLAGLIGAGGNALASIAMGGVAVAAVVFAALAVPRSARISGPWLAVAMVLSGLVMAQVLGVRGQVLSVLGVAMVLFVITRWREGRNGFLWMLPPLFLLWANLHAGFIAGLVILAIAALVARPVAPATVANRRLMAAAIAGSVATTLINPAGFGIYPYILDTFANPTLTQTITEWASPDFHNVWLRVFEGEVILLVLFWVTSGGPEVFDALIAGGTLVATLLAQRNVSLFAVVALPQVARYGARAWTIRIAPMLQQRWQRSALRSSPLVAGTVVAAVAVGVGITLAPQLTPSAAAAYEASRYPQAATNYVATHFPGQRLYSIDTWGGYLVYRFPQGRVVFLYDETAVFGDAALEKYLDIHLLRPGWAGTLSAEGIQHAIVPAHSQEASGLHELAWRVDCYDATSESLVMSEVPPAASATVPFPLTLPPPGATSC
jgi:hypothetical protein